jgi:hypothetical protein
MIATWSVLTTSDTRGQKPPRYMTAENCEPRTDD